MVTAGTTAACGGDHGEETVTQKGKSRETSGTLLQRRRHFLKSLNPRAQNIRKPYIAHAQKPQTYEPSEP